MQKDYKQWLSLLGGLDNIVEMTHCTTRLRILVQSIDKVDLDSLRQEPMIIEPLIKGGQVQLVIGTHVEKVYRELIEVISALQYEEKSNPPTKTSETLSSQTLLAKVMMTISGLFAPLIGILTASGLLKGMLSISVAAGWLTHESGLFVLVNAMSDAVFYFLPVVISISASKRFKVPLGLAAVIGLSLVYPTLAPTALEMNEPLMVLFKDTVAELPVYFKLFGIPLILPQYANGILPPIGAIWLASKCYPFFEKHVPRLLQSFVVPLLTFVSVLFLTFMFVGPLLTLIGNSIALGLTALYEWHPIVAGFVLGGVWQWLVVMGLHWALLPIGLLNLGTLGYDPLLVLMTATWMAQSAAVAGVLLKEKSKELNSIGIPALLSSLFGIIEPSLYGIVLPRKKVFFVTTIASASAGMILGWLKVKTYTVTGFGLFSLAASIHPETGIGIDFYGRVLAVLIAGVIAFIGSYFVTKKVKFESK